MRKRRWIIIISVLVTVPLLGIVYFQFASRNAKVEKYLNEARLESEEVIEKSLQDMRDFFADAKSHSPAFVSDALSLASKWRLAIDSIPAVERTGWRVRLVITQGERNERYLNDRFEARIFSADRLIDEIEQVVRIYIMRVEHIENNMLTRMKEDLPNLPETSILRSQETSQIFDTFQTSVETAIADSQTKAGEALTVEISAVIAGEILAAVAVRLGVSAGILGTGAAASLKSAGISIVVAVIVDYAVSWIWDWYADSKGELETKINEQIDQICDVVLEELRQKLLDISNSRVPVRRNAIRKLLIPIN